MTQTPEKGEHGWAIFNGSKTIIVDTTARTRSSAIDNFIGKRSPADKRRCWDYWKTNNYTVRPVLITEIEE